MTKQLLIWSILVVLLYPSGESTAQQRKLRILRDSTERQEKMEEAEENPGARLQWEFERTRDPRTNTLPANIAAREYVFASGLPARYPASKGQGVQVMQWMPVGPVNVGGRTRALAVDINGTGVMLAGGVSGGMWRSTDDGESWTKVTQPNELQSVSCVAQDRRPGNTNVWYYGTGELLSTTDRRVDTLKRTLATGNGIYKSTDNGSTWSLLPSTSTSGAASGLQEHFQGVWRLAVDNSNTAASEVYAACYGGIMRSTDGGSTWSLTLGNSERKSFNSEVTITSGGVVYAAIGSLRDTTKSPKQGMWRSTDGVNWTDITPIGFPKSVRRTVVALSPSNEKIMYVLTETALVSASGLYDFSASRHSLWRYTYISGDGSGAGGRWQELSDRLPGGPVSTDLVQGYNSIGGYCMALAVHPENSDVVYFGGTNLFRTTDGFASGFTIEKIGGYPNSWQPDDLHPDLHAIVFYPGSPSVMCVGGDGGLTWTFDNLASTVEWKVQNNGYVSSQFYSVALDRATANDPFVIGGLQDNGSFGTDDANPKAPWTIFYGGDGTGSAVANQKEALYVSSQSGNILQLRYDEELGGYDYTGFSKPSQLSFDDFYFITLFALEPTETNIMYMAAKDRLWRHSNLSDPPEFQGAFDPYWEEIEGVETDRAAIMALAPSVQPAHILYIGTNNGRVLRIDDANKNAHTVTSVTSNSFPANAVVSSISVDPDNADNVLVSFSNYNVRSLFYSTNGGDSWTDVSGNLEEKPDGSGVGPSVRCVKIHRTGDAVYYFAGTSTGLYSTTNLAGDATVWAQEGPTVIGNVMVEAIDSRSVDGRVVIGTQGNGVFAGNIPAVSVGEPGVPTALLLEQNFPNPTSTSTRVKFHLPSAMNVRLLLFNTTGERVLIAVDKAMVAGEHYVDISVADLAPGAYFYRLQAGNDTQTRMMTVVK